MDWLMCITLMDIMIFGFWALAMIGVVTVVCWVMSLR